MIRYVRAFFRALSLTLRGQKPPSLIAEESHAALVAWCKESLVQLDAVKTAIEQNHLDGKSVEMHIEGRDVTLEHALSVVRYHNGREYPHLIRSSDPHTVAAIHALNLNDQFLVMRLKNYEGLPAPVKKTLDSLGEHLAKIPQS